MHVTNKCFFCQNRHQTAIHFDSDKNTTKTWSFTGCIHKICWLPNRSTVSRGVRWHLGIFSRTLPATSCYDHIVRRTSIDLKARLGERIYWKEFQEAKLPPRIHFIFLILISISHNVTLRMERELFKQEDCIFGNKVWACQILSHFRNYCAIVFCFLAKTIVFFVFCNKLSVLQPFCQIQKSLN